VALGERSRDLRTVQGRGIVARGAYEELDLDARITGGEKEGTNQEGTSHGVFPVYQPPATVATSRARNVI